MDWLLRMSLKFSWPGRPDGWTSIDSQGGIFCVSLKLPHKLGDRPIVVKNAALPGATLTHANLLKMGKLIGDQGYPVVAILNSADYQIFLLDKAAVKAEEIESSLRWSLSPLLDYPAMEANLSWLAIPKTQSRSNTTTQLHVIAARSEMINQRMDLFEHARMPAQIIDIRETAQRNISAAIQDQDAAVCLIYADSFGVRLTVSYKGELYLARTIHESLFDAKEESVTDSIEHKFDRVALEVQRSIDFVRRNYASMAFDGVYVAPTQININFQVQLESRLSTEIKTLDMSSIFEWPADSDLVKPEVQSMYFNALGAAMRMKESLS